MYSRLTLNWLCSTGWLQILAIAQSQPPRCCVIRVSTPPSSLLKRLCRKREGGQRLERRCKEIEGLGDGGQLVRPLPPHPSLLLGLWSQEAPPGCLYQAYSPADHPACATRCQQASTEPPSGPTCKDREYQPCVQGFRPGLSERKWLGEALWVQTGTRAWGRVRGRAMPRVPCQCLPAALLGRKCHITA